MPNTIDQIDPAWAWSPYDGQSPRVWSRLTAAHLLRRAGFGFTSAQLDDAVAKQPSAVVRSLVYDRSESDQFQKEISAVARTVLAGGDSEQLGSWWTYRLLHTPDQLREKMTLFWHGHFATGAEKVDNADAMFAQNEFLREHALGDFGALAHAISRDPAMLVYLDSVTNRKSHPNENYARELMELFCLGEGNYTEGDVQQLARCFTGWEIKRGKYRFNRFQHDTGEKQILGQSGKFTGDDGVDIVLAQDAAAEFIATKLFHFFVCDEPHPSPALIAPLAQTLREHDMNVAPLVEKILSSNLFFSDTAVARKIRSPVEMAIGLMRCLDATTNTNKLSGDMREVGQGLFYPPNVKGWDGGRTWINSSTLLGRANLVRELLHDESTRFAGGELEAYLDQQYLESGAEIVGWLAEMLLAVELAPHARKQLIEVVDNGNGALGQRIKSAIYAMSSLPEFHLG